MPKYVIERDIPGAGKLSAQELHAIAQKSCGVLRDMGPQVQWIQSYVTDDKIYCVYIAPGEDAIKKHAQVGGFPANRISRVRTVIDPTRNDRGMKDRGTRALSTRPRLQDRDPRDLKIVSGIAGSRRRVFEKAVDARRVAG